MVLIGELPNLPPEIRRQAPDGRTWPAGVTPRGLAALLGISERYRGSGLHRLLANTELLGFVLVNDAQALRTASVPRERMRILEHLGALDNNATFNELLDLLDRYVLGSDEPQSVAGRGRGASHPADEDDRHAREDVPFGPRGVSSDSKLGADARQWRLKDGLVSEIIAALLRALAAPPPPRTDGDAPDLDPGDDESGGSSENLATNLEAELDVRPIDWPRLVTACRKRLGLMIDRLEKRLEEASRGERTPEWALGRLLVVLCLLQRLRGYLPQGVWAPLNVRIKPKSLVSIEHLKRAFSVALRFLYGAAAARLAETLESSDETRAAREREQLDNVLFWFAREIGADWNVRAGNGLTNQVLQARADLIPVAMSAAAHPRLEVWATNS